MVRQICFLLLALSFANLLFSQDIDQSWGLSAGIYENKINEISVSYGLSDKTMLLFFTNLNYENRNTDVDYKATFVNTENKKYSNIETLVGAELRGFFYLSRVAPFGGVRFSGGWNSLKDEKTGSDWSKTHGLELNLGLTYGVEYFFNKALSVYLSMNLFNYTLSRQISEEFQNSSGTKIENTTKTHKIDFSQHPAIFLKIYF
jgi:hypothetical protein